MSSIPANCGRRRELSRWMSLAFVGGAVLLAPLSAQSAAASKAMSNPVQTLRNFVKQAQTGQAEFTQVVISPDGQRRRHSAGTLAFQRPERFRFAYTSPSEQLIVSDGKQVWLYDVDLEQVTVRPMSQAVGSTPAAILSSAALERDFVLKAIPAPTAGAVTATPASAPGGHEMGVGAGHSPSKGWGLPVSGSRLRPGAPGRAGHPGRLWATHPFEFLEVRDWGAPTRRPVQVHTPGGGGCAESALSLLRAVDQPSRLPKPGRLPAPGLPPCLKPGLLPKPLSKP